MREAIVYSGPKVKIIESPIPTPGPSQVLIRVAVSGSNPKDWKHPEWVGSELNQGDDIAGTVESVGSAVFEFRPGDRVAAFHTMFEPHGSFAEFAVAEAHTTAKIPPGLSFEAAATMPLAVLTAAVALHVDLALPAPWFPAQKEIPLIIYGGASAVGAFAIKLATAANIHPLIVVAGKGIPFVEGLIDKSKGDLIIDYREGDEKVVQGLKDAVAGREVLHAFDPTSEKGSYENISKVLSRGSTISLVLPGKKYEEIPDHIHKIITSVSTAQKTEKEIAANGPPPLAGPQLINGDFCYAIFRWVFKSLAEGGYTAHPYEVIPGGLRGVEEGLTKLRDGKASAVKYVFRIAET
jgi:NADPH:quinone reductase